VIVLDAINTNFLDQDLARRALTKYLASNVDPKQAFALVSINSKGVKIFPASPTIPQL
jgi:hypothetical protein